MKTLTIRLTAPLQSYGNEASFERRTTWPAPSKSAVIGMIAAALGMRREDERIKSLNDLLFAVRIDQVGKVMTEFQTVEWKKETRKLTYRDHYQDAVYVAAVGSEDEDLIEKIEYVLKHPRFQLYLGRRACPPAGVLQIESFEAANPVEVLEKMPWQAEKWYQKKRRWQSEYTAEIIADANLLPDAAFTQTMKDRVESFDPQNRRFGFRLTAKERISLKNPCYKDSPDIMDYL
ncbi:type I-E CRISPR-associated protein Cas5/CasD [Lactobacillus nasalidis]|uniref:Type I-E CRISPR-associated protein Cas5/CasD n=1 Tax=Lactobacillus nasalidis TaxID=2797258 RepID=A0ABQ3W518_9LACO|nr:type I-E CRISPR-associated protein Cas5/CasD [Lactobacillus nasalidis]GHV97777.1 type I-E CRISPR-associated protein Cas5/CasD [Lactobacillus nasalidis]GHV99096.1 type I-E CRISPR-associated protein Cas5/CasD [Lactobacillus nasalidis]GHW01636.1 type I-E CRISPR-associated protein Cas5/CasD [Lactobacillus nasalidis]